MKSKNSPGRIRIVLLGAAVILTAVACGVLTDTTPVVTPIAVTSIPTTTRVVISSTPTPIPTPTPASKTSGCAQPLEDETLNRLEFSLGALSGVRELQPGESTELALGVVECCHIFEIVPSCVAWSVEPESAASIDPQTGELSVYSETEDGTVLTVTANIEDGKHILTQDILIYTLDENPHVGYWRETAQLSCEDGSEITPNALIEELLFQANGSFSVTWAPFELYHDYWGTYTLDPQTGALELSIERGNHIPENVDLSGQLRIDENGRLILENMWLGEPIFEQLPPTCGHIFE